MFLIRHIINEADLQVDDAGAVVCIFGIVQDITDRVLGVQVAAEQSMRIASQSHPALSKGVIHCYDQKRPLQLDARRLKNLNFPNKNSI